MKDLSQGRVLLVGAGPGDPELLTVKALRAIQTADVVVFDRLVSPEIMALIPGTTRRIDVGKSPKCHKLPQDDINALLVALASDGLMVARLKGGDPLIFGRGSEEAAVLRKAGIDCDYIPGITSAQGRHPRPACRSPIAGWPPACAMLPGTAPPMRGSISTGQALPAPTPRWCVT